MPIRLPICNFDAKTGILCANCESRLKAGEIGGADVSASMALITIAEKGGKLNRAELTHAFETGGSYVLEFASTDFDILRDDCALHSELEGILKGRVWMVEEGVSDKRFLEDLLYPVRVLTVNTVWLPDGSRRTKVIIPGRRTERQIGDFDMLRAAARRARGIELLLETEREALVRAES